MFKECWILFKNAEEDIVVAALFRTDWQIFLSLSRYLADKITLFQRNKSDSSSKEGFLTDLNNNKSVFLCVIPVQSRERVAKNKAKNGQKFQNSASKLK